MKCGICGMEFGNDQFDEYAAHVKTCAYEAGLKKKTEEMKKINEKLEELKRAKVCYEGLRDDFKDKYPDVYAANFKDEHICSCRSEDKKSEKKSDKASDNSKIKCVEVDGVDLFDIMNEIAKKSFMRD